MSDSKVIDDAYDVLCPGCGRPTGAKFIRAYGYTTLQIGGMILGSWSCQDCGGRFSFARTTRTVEDLLANQRARWQRISDQLDRLSEQVRNGDVAGIEADVASDK